VSLTIYQGQLDIVLPDGSRHDYERFIITRNPDGSRTMRTVTKSPKGDLLRDVNQMVRADWRPIEAMAVSSSKARHKARCCAESLATDCCPTYGPATARSITPPSTHRPT